MYDESALWKWMSLEMRKINEGIVHTRIPLSTLLDMERPVSSTRGGQEFRFDRGVLERIGSMIPPSLAKRLRLPVIFYFDMDVPESCFLTDRVALEALQEMGELSRERVMDGDSITVGRAIVFSLIRSYPTAFQIMMR